MEAFTSVEDRWVDVKEAARISGLSRDYLYRHAKKLPFAAKVSDTIESVATMQSNRIRK